MTVLVEAPPEVVADTIWLDDGLSSWARKQLYIKAAASPEATHITREVWVDAPGFEEPLTTDDLEKLVDITEREFAALYDSGICIPDVQWYTHKRYTEGSLRLIARVALIEGLPLSSEYTKSPLYQACEGLLRHYYAKPSQTGFKIRHLGGLQCVLGYPRDGIATPSNAAFYMVDVDHDLMACTG